MPAMPRVTSAIVLASALALGACATAPPPVPSVMAFPGQGKSAAQFQQDDGACRHYAWHQIDYRTPGQVADESRAAGVALGTALGAAAGAFLGTMSDDPAAGAAFGAGSGLLLGSAIGANAAQTASAAAQRRYDLSYLQCMSASGNSRPSIAYPPYTDAYPAYLGNSYPANPPY